MKCSLSTATSCFGLYMLGSILLVAAMSCNQSTKSPQRPPNPDLPHMWMPQEASQGDEGTFLIFNQILKGINTGHKETDSIYFTLTAFQKLITTCQNLPDIAYLDMYPVVPPGGDTLYLMFIPKNHAYRSLGYYKLTANAIDFPQTGDVLTSSDSATWHRNYLDRISNLDIHLSTQDSYNYRDCKMDSSSQRKPSNTWYVHHCFSDFTEFLDEVRTQKDSNGVDITGIKVFFATKPPHAPSANYSLSNRLYVILEYTVNDPVPGTVYYVPKGDRNWPGPCLPIAQCPDEKGGNNGQMCPPTCNP
jgi:hypothetical protein